MTKEEKLLREFCHSTWFDCQETIEPEAGYKKEMALIRALIRAVREDCAREVDETGGVCERCAVALAAAIRKLK